MSIDTALEKVSSDLFRVRNSQNHLKKWINSFDYLQTSMKILEEITKRSGGIRLREDNVLFMLSNRLKDLANQYNIFVITATQLSGQIGKDDTPDQSLLRGSKAIADKADAGMLMLSVRNDELPLIEPILLSNKNFKKPNMKISVYKNRRGAYKGCYLWCHANLGTCRITPQFVTSWNYEMMPIEDIKVKFADEENAPWNKKGK